MTTQDRQDRAFATPRTSTTPPVFPTREGPQLSARRPLACAGPGSRRGRVAPGLAGIAVLLACASAAPAARADELQDLKAQIDALAKQNQALQKRIGRIAAQQGRKGFAPVPQSAEPPPPAPPQNQGYAASTLGGGGPPPPGGQTASGGAPTVQESRAASAATPVQAIGGTPPVPAADALTYKGITLYGAVDLGVSYQTHGTPLSSIYSPGLEYLISKNSNRSLVSVAPNALSYSNIGLRGTEPLVPGLAAVFNVQTQFVPTSGSLTNSVGASAQNNGVALNRQSSNGDSSRAGQPFQIAYAGLSSPRYGTLTFGRQNTLSLDSVIAYDPMFASNAFSVIGYSGPYAGAGDTEDTRLDSTLKYLVNYGPVHAGAFYQLASGNHLTANGTGSGAGRSSYQFDLGAEYQGLDVDAVYSQIYDAVSISPLTAAQVLTAATGSLAASVSDNRALLLDAKYKIGKTQLFVGYENIYYHNPRDPIANGSQGLGGYVLSIVNNTAYNNNKQLQVFWGGVREGITKKFYIDAAYYRVHQNSYSGTGCTNTSLPTCRGDLAAYSLLATYRVSPRFDVYAGAMLSTVSDGLSSGFINNTTIDPTVGGRFAF